MRRWMKSMVNDVTASSMQKDVVLVISHPCSLWIHGAMFGTCSCMWRSSPTAYPPLFEWAFQRPWMEWTIHWYGHRWYFWHTSLTFLSSFHHSSYLSLLLLFESTRCCWSPVLMCDADCHRGWQHDTFLFVGMCVTRGGTLSWMFS